jgi:peptidoglycan L-alanyl-D-glutamate endopeptidase CwlK
MINSRQITDLHKKVAALAIQHIDLCKQAGIDLLITSTYRDAEAQNALFAQGRTTPGKIVTRARAGQSVHNYRLAYDVVPIRNGKPVWSSSDPVWQEVGRIGESLGLEWAGRWKSFKEFPHFQYLGDLTIADLQQGKMIA